MDSLTVKKFLNFISEGYSKNLYWELRIIDQNGKVKQYFFKSFDKMVNLLADKKINSNYNCYVGVIGRDKMKGDLSAISSGNLFFIDLDNENAIKDSQKIYEKLSNELGIRPSLITNSGHGLHFYFKMNSLIEKKDWEIIQKQLLNFFLKNFEVYNPDSSVKDMSRVLRIPSTLNIKKNPYVETKILNQDFTTYNIDEFKRFLKDYRSDESKKIVQGQKQTLPRKKIPIWLTNILNLGIDEGKRHKMRFVIALNLWKRGFEENEILKTIRAFNQKCRPPELENILERHLKDIVSDSKRFLELNPETNINDYENIFTKLDEEQKNLNKIGKLKVLSEKELLELKTNPIQWFVESLIPQKAIVFIAGKRASYKSWGSIHLALSIANGVQAFNKFSTNKVYCLYLDAENGFELLKERIIKVKNGLGLNNPSENLGFVSFENIKLEDRDSLERIKNFLKEHSPTIIIADSFRRFIRAEENDATEMNKVFTELMRPISEEYNVTWILLHHLRKGISGKRPDDIMDELRGSSELTNYADSVIIFDRPPRLQNRFILRQVKSRRSIEEEPLIIEMVWDNDESVSFECIGKAEDIIDAIGLCAKSIMVWIEENQIEKFETKEVNEAMKSSSYQPKTVGRALKYLIEDNKILREKRGLYRVIRTYGQNGQVHNNTEDKR